MSERIYSSNPLEFNRLPVPENVDQGSTHDVLKTSIATSEGYDDANVTITLGDILDMPVHVNAIAYPYSGDRYITDGTLAQRITRLAGEYPFREAEAKQRARPPKERFADGAYSSSPGNLANKTDRILHVMYSPHTEEETATALERSVTEALMTAYSEGIDSIALPLFGTDPFFVYQLGPGDSLRRTVRTVEKFVKERPDTSTKDIRIVPYYEPTPQVIESVEESLQKL